MKIIESKGKCKNRFKISFCENSENGVLNRITQKICDENV